MDIRVDGWLRGENHATTYTISPVARAPREWTDADVSSVLVGMLRTLERAKNPNAPADRPVTLRGFSWIVNPLDPRRHRVRTVEYLRRRVEREDSRRDGGRSRKNRSGGRRVEDGALSGVSGG